MEPIYLHDVQANPAPGPRAEQIRWLEAAGASFGQIQYLLAYKPEMTIHLDYLTQAVMRGPSPLSPGLRELIAAFTSRRHECPF